MQRHDKRNKEKKAFGRKKMFCFTCARQEKNKNLQEKEIDFILIDQIITYTIILQKRVVIFEINTNGLR